MRTTLLRVTAALGAAALLAMCGAGAASADDLGPGHGVGNAGIANGGIGNAGIANGGIGSHGIGNSGVGSSGIGN